MPEFETTVQWPGWQTNKLIGRGSYATVYEIEREVFGRREKAALKVISIPQHQSDIEELFDSGYDEKSVADTINEQLQSFINEYAMMREMSGAANIVNCDDIRTVQHADGLGWDIYIKMELLTPMPRSLDLNPPEETVIRIGRDLCTALVLCKKYGIIHRDIKPQNIFVSRNGDYKLGDFGIAKTVERTSGGTKIGTYNYMAPEVFNNRPYGHPADIYSLGLVLYWLLNERRMPFAPLPPVTPTTVEMDEARARRFAGEPLPAPIHGSPALRRIVLKACAFEQEDRYQTADEMLQDLTEILLQPADAAGRAFAAFAPTEPATPPAPEENPEPEKAWRGAQSAFQWPSDKTVGLYEETEKPEPTPVRPRTSSAEATPPAPVVPTPAVSAAPTPATPRPHPRPVDAIPQKPTSPPIVRTGGGGQRRPRGGTPAPVPDIWNDPPVSETPGGVTKDPFPPQPVDKPRKPIKTGRGNNGNNGYNGNNGNSSKKGFLIGLISVLLVAALVVGGWWLWNSGALDGLFDREKTEEPVDEPTADSQNGNGGTEEPGSTDDAANAADAAWLAGFAPGDVVVFGRYEQDSDVSNGAEPIRWIVLERSGDRLLLLSQKCLESRPFHSGRENTVWADCQLRSWLNGDFLNTAFSDAEKAGIVQTVLDNPVNPVTSVGNGAATTDSLFLLSYPEVERYFPMMENAQAGSTVYALNKGAYQNETNGNTWWWLRSSGKDLKHAMYVYSYKDATIEKKDEQRGPMDQRGDYVDVKSGGVRPAVWVDLTAFGRSGLGLDPLRPTSMETAVAGDSVLFGSYEQDNDLSDGMEPVEWIVLARDGDRLLLLSRYCLDARPFQNVRSVVTWGESDLRAWLNGEFLNTAFSDQEKSRLQTAEINMKANPEYSTYGGSKTNDRVFLLSYDEVLKYMRPTAFRNAYATPYAAQNGAKVADNGWSWWWLRTPGRDREHAMYVYSRGPLDYSGDQVGAKAGGIRPAVWVSVG